MSSKNKLLQKHNVEAILNKLGNIGDDGNELKINNLVHYQTSFVHKSYLNQIDHKLFTPRESNERLEFLGDSFLGAVIANYLINRFGFEQEGFLTKLRTRLVRSNMLYRFARFLGLGEYILLSDHIERLTKTGSNKGRNNPRLYEDCFESFIGAIIQDFGDEDGYRYAKRFILNIVEHIIDFSDLIMYNENFKDILQRYFQSLKWTNPTYIDLHESGPSHMKTFVKGIFLNKEYLLELSPQVQENVHSYQSETILQQSSHVKAQIDSILASKECVLIGIGIANKKNIAEQSASNIALCCLNIDTHF